MKLSETIGGIKKNESIPRGIENAIFVYAVKSSDLLFEPSQDETYNLKHELECVMFSSITHILWIEAFYPNLLQKVKTVVSNNLNSLIRLSDPIEDFMDIDFINGYFERFKFYGEELARLPSLKSELPWKMLELIYDFPLHLDLKELRTEDAKFDIGNKMLQFMKLISYIDFVYESLPQIVIEYSNQM